jgi:alanine dehydrogenase
MKQCSVVIDVAIDQAGCFETSKPVAMAQGLDFELAEKLLVS